LNAIWEREGFFVTRKSEESRIKKFVEQCRTARLKVTPQRLLIYQALLRDESHPSPDKLYRRIKRSHPTISHATVYAALESFERHGIVARLTPLHETVRFDPIVEPHHHVVCVRCKKVTNLLDSDFESLSIPEHVQRENTVLGHSVYVNVLCPACRRSAARG
jgi:Fur family peroxide stress response transcriptional regulator